MAVYCFRLFCYYFPHNFLDSPGNDSKRRSWDKLPYGRPQENCFGLLDNHLGLSVLSVRREVTWIIVDRLREVKELGRKKATSGRINTRSLRWTRDM